MSVGELNSCETPFCCPEQQEENCPEQKEIGYLSLSSKVRCEVKKLNKENNIQLDENTIEKIVLSASTLNAQGEQFSENSIFFLDNAIVFPREKAIAIRMNKIGKGVSKTVHECALIIFKGNSLVVTRKALITISTPSPSDEEFRYYYASVKKTLQGNKILETFRNCPFIMNPYDFWGEGLMPNQNRAFVSIADLYDNDLLENNLSYQDRIKALLDISKGLNFLHKGGYVHSDIKPDNFLFRCEGQAALTDFDLSGKKDEPLMHGSFLFLSPEIVLGKCHKLCPENDIWAMGIVFLQKFHPDTYKVITGMPKNLFSSRLDRNGCKKLLLEELEKLDDSSTDPMLNNLIKNCLKINPNERCSAEEIAWTLQMILEKESQEVLKAS